MKTQARLVILGWLTTIVALFFYSFTQIDLGLTLTRASFWQPIQKTFQTLGYFHRPLSAFCYLTIILALFVFYFLIWRSVKKQWFSSKQIWILIFITAGWLWFAYNAFSYDLFNYVFDAKIVTFYRANPYQHKALDFPGDPMLGFMHWTHRLYPYGPVWLLVTVLLSFSGFQKLLPTLILMKGLAVGAYLLTAWFIYRVLALTNPKKKLEGLAVFAFSPLVVLESLVSAHNDTLMMAFLMGGFWFLIKRKPVLTWTAFLFSVGVKFASVLLLPIFFLAGFWQRGKKKINWDKVWLFSFWLMGGAVILACLRSELKPWYLLYLWPLVALTGKRSYLFFLAVFSLGGLLHYAPFLYLGNWDPPVPRIKLGLSLSFLAIGAAFLFPKKCESKK